MSEVFFKIKNLYTYTDLYVQRKKGLKCNPNELIKAISGLWDYDSFIFLIFPYLDYKIQVNKLKHFL